MAAPGDIYCQALMNEVINVCIGLMNLNKKLQSCKKKWCNCENDKGSLCKYHKNVHLSE